MVGLEPTRYCYQRILSPSRLPFHHTGLQITCILYHTRALFAIALRKKVKLFEMPCLFAFKIKNPHRKPYFFAEIILWNDDRDKNMCYNILVMVKITENLRQTEVKINGGVYKA